MRAVRISITVDQGLLAQIDRLVASKRFSSRDCAIQQAVRHKFGRPRRSRLARECAKLDSAFEQALAESWQ